MACCVGDICTKNYQKPIIDFHVTVENVWDTFLRHSLYNGYVFFRFPERLGDLLQL